MFEKVNPCHPDKVADRIAGAIVDLAYTKNKNPKVAVEVLLDTPVVLKDGTMMTKPDGSPMTKQEAIATNILNLAMKGDVKAAQYIQNIQMRAKIMKKK